MIIRSNWKIWTCHFWLEKKELDEITNQNLSKINNKRSPVQNVNYLGVALDRFLSWDVQQVNDLC